MPLLESAKLVAENRLEPDLRNRIQDIVRSYRHFWDPLAEPLQNSVDAINRRYGVLNDPDHYLYEEWRRKYTIEPDPSYTGKILIELRPEIRKVSIFDNGAGIPKDRIEYLLLPEGSDKRRGKDYGYKGKGLTYVAFASESFMLRTQFMTTDTCYEWGLDGLFGWLSADEGQVPFPTSPTPTPQQCNLLPDGYNTEVSFTLADNYDEVFPAISSLNSTFDLAKEERLIDGLQVVLRTRTAVGNTRPLFNQAPVVPIEVTLRVVQGSEVWERDIPYRYFHPREHEDFNADSFSFEGYLQERLKVGFNGNFRCMYFQEQSVRVGSRLPITCDYHVSALSSKRLSEVNDSLGFEGPGLSEAGLTYGVHLSIAGMPTGIRIDDWDERGHDLKRYFVVVDVALQVSEELDSGRKGISNNRAQQLSEKARRLLQKKITTPQGSESDRFSSYASKHLDWGLREQIIEEETDFEARLEVASAAADEDRAEDSILLDTLVEASSLTHFPRSEEEVRVLFHELLAKERIKGYSTIYSSGSRALYDSALAFELDLDRKNLHPNDPLGFSGTLAKELVARGERVYRLEKYYRRMKMGHPQLCVEFKPSLDSFLQEVVVRPARSPKSAKEIDLLIVWSDEVSASVPEDSYTVAAVGGEKRTLHAVTHRLNLISPESTEIQCIVLRSVLRSL